MAQVRVDGLRLHCEERGEGDAILGIHGTSSSAAAWTGALATLATRGRAIAYDRRGCGRSDRPEPYATSLAEQAGDAAALIHALGAAPAVVVGRSYGADVAIELALRHPGCVRALALLEGGEGVTAAGRAWLAGLVEEVLTAAEADPATAAEALWRAVAGDAWDGLADDARAALSANGPAIVAELRGGFLEATPERLSAIARPTLVVSAQDSPPIFAEVAEVLAAAIPGARLAHVAGGHLIDPAHPVVLAFIDEVLAR